MGSEHACVSSDSSLTGTHDLPLSLERLWFFDQRKDHSNEELNLKLYHHVLACFALNWIWYRLRQPFLDEMKLQPPSCLNLVMSALKSHFEVILLSVWVWNLIATDNASFKLIERNILTILAWHINLSSYLSMNFRYSDEIMFPWTTNKMIFKCFYPSKWFSHFVWNNFIIC